MYNYIEKEIEDMIENNAHRYRYPADTPLEEVLSPESVSLIRNLGVWSENLIKDVYAISDKNADMDFDPNSRKIWRELYDAIGKMDEGLQKEIVILLSNGYSIEDICESLKLSIEEYRINYKQTLIKLRAMFAAIVDPIVITCKEGKSEDITYTEEAEAADLAAMLFGRVSFD